MFGFIIGFVAGAVIGAIARDVFIRMLSMP